MVFLFDLETITQRYTGEAALQRLVWVGQQDPSLAANAFRTAVDICMQRKNTSRYKSIYEQPNVASLGLPALDTKWVSETESQNRRNMESLEGKLRTAEAHLNKDAIRSAYTELSDFMAQTGELSAALTYILKAKDYCSSRQQQASNSHRILSLAVFQRNYPTIRDLVARVETSGMKTSVSVLASALERLQAGDMVAAALKFREVALGEVSTNPEVSTDLDFLSLEDIALYAGVTNLAADRLVAINLAEHLSALEPAPILRKVLLHFHKNSEHREACKHLEDSVWPALKYDIFFSQCNNVSPPLVVLQKSIRSKAIGQYWKPYNRCSLTRMAGALGPSIAGTPAEFRSTVRDLLFDKHRFVLPRDTRLDARTDTLVRDMVADEVLTSTTNKLHNVSMQVLDDTFSLLVRTACNEQGIQVGDVKRPRYDNQPTGVAAHRVEMSDDELDGDAYMDTSIDDAMNPEDLY